MTVTYGLLRVKNFALHVLRLVQFLALEVFVVDPLRQLHSTHVQLRLCGDHIDLVDTAQWAAIQMVGTCNRDGVI